MEEDKIYVLCEFVNEDLKDNEGADRPVQVAHADWLVLDEPNVPISTLIQEEREIIVKWPENYNVQPKEAMAKISMGIKWINTVAILKAQSNEWTEIVDASKNIVKYGVPFPTKQQRKELAKKKDFEDDDSDAKKLLKPLGEKKKFVQNKRDDKLFVTAKTVREKKSKLKDDDFLDSVRPLSKKRDIKMVAKTADIGIKQQKRKRKEKQTYIISSSSDDSSEESKENKLSKSQLSSKINILEAENKRLRNDLKLYKTMHVIIEEFPRLKSKIKDLSSRCKCCRHNKQKDGLCEKDSEVLEIGQKAKDVKSEDISSSFGENKIYQDELDLSFHKKQINEIASSESTLPNENSEEPVIQDQGTQKSSLIETQKDSLHKTHKEYNPTKIMILFGSKRLSLATVQTARHSKLSVLAAELCSLVFTTRELALCSLKGKKTNAHKNAFQKQLIDEDKVKGIIEYIAKYYSKFPEDIKDEVYKAIGNKLNNFSKTSEGKKIINEHLAEKAQQQELVQQQQLIEANQQQIAAIEMQEKATLPPTATQLDKAHQQRQIPHSIVTLQSDAAHEQKRAEYERQQFSKQRTNQKTAINTSDQEKDNTLFLQQLTILQQIANPKQKEAIQQIIKQTNKN